MNRLAQSILALLLLCGAANAQATNCLVPINAGATPVVSTTTSASIVFKGSPGCLVGAYVLSPATSGYFMMLNSKTVPADGAVAPLECVPVAANSYQYINFAPQPPEFYSTGIVGVFSTTGCLTKTLGTSAWFHALVQ